MLLCYFFSSGWFNGIRFSFTVGVFITFVALTLDYVFFLISRFQNVLWFNAIITICVNVASMYSSVTTKRLVRMFALISVDLLVFTNCSLFILVFSKKRRKRCSRCSLQERISKQECITVGCVPSAAVTVLGEGGFFSGRCLPGGRGVGGVCLEGCTPPPPNPEAYTPPGSRGGHPPFPPLPEDRILDTRLWKHYLSATIVAYGNNVKFIFQV